MINVHVVRSGRGIESVEIKGHSGYAKYGKDIVCSAISAVAQTALLGLISVSEDKPEYVIGESGYMKFAVPEHKSETESIKQQAIVETMLLGIADIEKGYSAFVKSEVSYND